METKDLNKLYQTASALIESHEFHALQYATLDQLAMWCVRCIENYNQRKVLTERIYGHQDLSIILSDNRLSVILNDTGQQSWVKVENLITYEDIELDIDSLMQALDYVLIKIEMM